MISKISVIVELFKAIENYIHCGKILFKKSFFILWRAAQLDALGQHAACKL